MNPVATILEGRITLETPGDHPFTIDLLKDLHSHALMVGLPLNAIITRIAWHLRPSVSDPQQISVYWQVKPATPRLMEEAPTPPPPPASAHPHPHPHPFPNPISTQE